MRLSVSPRPVSLVLPLSPSAPLSLSQQRAAALNESLRHMQLQHVVRVQLLHEGETHLVDQPDRAVYLWPEEERERERDAATERETSALRAHCAYTHYLLRSHTHTHAQALPRSLSQLLQRLLGLSERESLARETGIGSRFLSLCCSEIIDDTLTRTLTHADTHTDAQTHSHTDTRVTLSQLRVMRVGVDAIELRADTLSSLSAHTLHRTLALLRNACPGVPVVFTLRSASQLGRFPDWDCASVLTRESEGDSEGGTLSPPHTDTLIAEAHTHTHTPTDTHTVAERATLRAERERVLCEAVRAAAEYVDVESHWPAQLTHTLAALAHSRQSRVIGSFHCTHPLCGERENHEQETVTERERLRDVVRTCELGGTADVVKVVQGGAGPLATQRFLTAMQRVMRERNTTRPHIALSLGAEGAVSRVHNAHYTPVTHASLSVAAPGQLSARTVESERLRAGLSQPTQLSLFGGASVAHSLSPLLHNTALRTLLIPAVYTVHPAESAEEYREVMSEQHSTQYALSAVADPESVWRVVSDVHNAYDLSQHTHHTQNVNMSAINAQFARRSFFPLRGASVTIPHKETIAALCESDEEAQCVGAVNTLCREVRESNESWSESAAWSGHNTDWLGIYRPVRRLLTLRKANRESTRNKDDDPERKAVGLVIGAGGTARAACYALQRLDLDIVVANRNPVRACELAREFNGESIPLADVVSLLENTTAQAVISTLPHSAQFSLPVSLLQRDLPVVLDVVYSPALTPLLAAALSAGCLTVQGATMLFEQAVEQFQRWMGRCAPRFEMESALFHPLVLGERIDSCGV